MMGVFIKWKNLYFSFHQKWSKLGTLLQADDDEAEIKKKKVHNLCLNQCTLKKP